MCLAHLKDVSTVLDEFLAECEALIRRQLCAAAGRDLASVDFASYARWQQHNLLDSEFTTVSVRHAVPSKSPSEQCQVSLEESLAGNPGASEPVLVTTSRAEAATTMKVVAVSDADITFRGDCYLHLWIQPSFLHKAPTQVQLAVKAQKDWTFLRAGGQGSIRYLIQPRALYHRAGW
jgi:hypothetical protein